MCMCNTLTRRFIYDTRDHHRRSGRTKQLPCIITTPGGAWYYIVNKRRRYFADAFRAHATVNVLLGIIKKKVDRKSVV